MGPRYARQEDAQRGTPTWTPPSGLAALRPPSRSLDSTPMPQPDEPPPLAQRIMLVTDAWAPQVNGVVRTLERLVMELRALGCEVEVVSPADGYRTIPLVTYSEIRLALWAREDIEARFTRFAP